MWLCEEVSHVCLHCHLDRKICLTFTPSPNIEIVFPILTSCHMPKKLSDIVNVLYLSGKKSTDGEERGDTVPHKQWSKGFGQE